MFERFSDASRRVVVLAQDEARSLDHAYVGTEHLLLGVLDEGENPAAQLLYDMGITDDAVRKTVVDHFGLGDEVTGDEIPFSPRAKSAIEAAFRTAQRRATQVEPSHLLLGALSQEGAHACRVLQVLEIEPRELRLGLAAEVGEMPASRLGLQDLRAATAMRALWPRRVPFTRQVGGLEPLDLLSDAALAALAAARREARRLGQQRVIPEFLAIGLLVAEGEARDRLRTAGARAQAARRALDALFLPGEPTTDAPIELDETVRLALERPRLGSETKAIRSADVLGVLLARSAGVALLLHAAGADLALLRELTRADGGGAEGNG